MNGVSPATDVDAEDSGFNGPCGPLFREVIEASDALDVLLPEVPCGITHDPRAEPGPVTLTKLALARDLLDQVTAVAVAALEPKHLPITPEQHVRDGLILIRNGRHFRLVKGFFGYHWKRYRKYKPDGCPCCDDD
jgi:hypothetical protein